jgi:hypothetical protein
MEHAKPSPERLAQSLLVREWKLFLAEKLSVFLNNSFDFCHFWIVVIFFVIFYLKELFKKTPAMVILSPRKVLLRMLDRPSQAWVGHIRQPRRARVANLFTGMARAQQGELDWHEACTRSHDEGRQEQHEFSRACVHERSSVIIPNPYAHVRGEEGVTKAQRHTCPAVAAPARPPLTNRRCVCCVCRHRPIDMCNSTGPTATVNWIESSVTTYPVLDRSIGSILHIHIGFGLVAARRQAVGTSTVVCYRACARCV